MKRPDNPGVSRDGWSLSDERAFVENLLNTRFNFFLVVFGAVIAGMLAAQKTLDKQIVLITGASICWLITLTLWRTQQKLDILLKMIFEDDTHPVTRATKRAKRFISVRKIVGYILPTACSLLLTVASVLALEGRL